MKNDIEGIQGHTLQLARAEQYPCLIYSNIRPKQAFEVIHSIYNSALRDPCEF